MLNLKGLTSLDTGFELVDLKFTVSIFIVYFFYLMPMTAGGNHWHYPSIKTAMSVCISVCCIHNCCGAPKNDLKLGGRICTGTNDYSFTLVGRQTQKILVTITNNHWQVLPFCRKAQGDDVIRKCPHVSAGAERRKQTAALIWGKSVLKCFIEGEHALPALH